MRLNRAKGHHGRGDQLNKVSVFDTGGTPVDPKSIDTGLKVILTRAEARYVLAHPEEQREAAGQHVLKLRERGRPIDKLIRQGAQKESDKRATERAKVKRRAKNKAARKANR